MGEPAMTAAQVHSVHLVVDGLLRRAADLEAAPERDIDRIIALRHRAKDLLRELEEHEACSHATESSPPNEGDTLTPGV